MAGNEEHPFASIVAAYRESQAPAPDTDDAATETAPIDEPAVVAASPQAATVEQPAPIQEPAAVETAAASEELTDDPTPAEPTATSAAEPAAETDVVAPVEEPTPAMAAEDVPEAEKPSALVDPFKSILAAYYAQSVEEPSAPKVDPAPVDTQPEPEPVEPEAVEPEPVVEASDAAASVLAAYYADPPETPADVSAVEPAAEASAEPFVTPEEPAIVDAVEMPAEIAAVEEPPADEPEPPSDAHATGAWGRHAVPAAATGAAASVLAAYYAGSPETPEDVPAAEPVDEAARSVIETAAAEAAPTSTDATAVLPTVTDTSFLATPANPLGNRPASRGWGEQALAAAAGGATSPIEPANETLPAAVQHRATEFIDTSAEEEKNKERSEARRKFLMLAPIGAIAALAVLAVLLWNGDKSTPKSTQSPSTTPSIVLVGSPLKRTQEAYASVLTRFNNANDAGSAVVAGGAAHDTLKLLKDFKGATAHEKALLAAERAHLTSLSDLATASPGGFGGAAGQAKNALAAVRKAAAADPKAGAPNGSAATAQAIDLLGEGNVNKLQVSLNSLVSRADTALLTAQLRGVASDAAGDADAANSISSVIKNPSVQTTASQLATKFSAMAPMARLSGDTLSDWYNIRPGMASALGADPVNHIDNLIASAKQKIAAWQANQGNNADTQAINAYASAMRSHFGAFGSALGQIPSLNPGESCSAGAKDGTRSRAGNAALAVSRAAFGGNPPASLVAAHNSLVNAINAGTAAATAGQNVTVLCGNGTYGSSSDWGTYSNNIWIKGGWGGKVGAWESAVSAALQQASASGTKPVV
ncbi:hypothetical protein [Nocardioides baekrokdamisoli]|uniref:hypothetical protein n=1 Tax=Nocardioides baekrokdamisoli TaxID=1804624 RepID=UPI000F779B12|nr:hypothetical protein [Nocardioides baekrokdamisoli]